MRKIVALALVMTFVLGSAPLFAQGRTYNPALMLDEQIQKGAESDRYLAKAPSQLFRGMHNTAFGWSEIVTDVFQPPFGLGTALSPITGPVSALAKTGSGVVDLLTFWIPGFSGFSV